jgi:hypothetical protein
MNAITLSNPRRNGTNALLLGATNHEAIANPAYTRFPNHHAEFRLDSGSSIETIPYGGTRHLEWGGKAPATIPLAPFRRRRDFRQQLGGGLRNTAAHLACMKRFRPAHLTAFDTAEPDATVESEMTAQGIEHQALALHPVTTSVVLTKSGVEASRVCLTEPPVGLADAGGVEFDFKGGSGIAVINSCKSIETVRRFSDAALRAGFAQYSVVNTAIPKAERISLLFGRDAASVCNLEEFATVAPHLQGVADEERTANLEWVALSLAGFAREHETGDLAVTLGRRGTLVADRSTGLVAHVALASRFREKVDYVLRQRPDLVLGSGDRWFGAFVACHSAFGRNPRRESRAVNAALEASASVVNSYSTKLQATAKWFTVRLFEHRYVA